MSSAPRKVWHERAWFRHGILLVVITALSLALARVGLLERFEAVTFDRRMSGRPRRPMDVPAAVCAIDDESLRQFGRWPWPRDRMAEVLRLLSQAGARAVMLDIEYSESSTPEADRALAAAICEAGNTQGVAHLQIGGSEQERLVEHVRTQMTTWVEKQTSANLAQLPAEIERIPEVAQLLEEARLRVHLESSFETSAESAAQTLGLGFDKVNRSIEPTRAAVLRKTIDGLFRRHPDRPPDFYRAQIAASLGLQDPQAYETQIESLLQEAMTGREVMRRWGLPADRFAELAKPKTAPSMLAPIPELTNCFSTVGYSNFLPDLDGVVRRVPLVWLVDGKMLCHPALTLAIQSLNAEPASLRAGPDGALEFSDVAGRKWQVPVDEEGQMLINWAGAWEAVPHFSISGVLDAINLETAYLHSLAELDNTGQIEELTALARVSRPWSRSPSAHSTAAARALTLEAQILQAGRDSVAAMEARVREHATDVGGASGRPEGEAAQRASGSRAGGLGSNIPARPADERAAHASGRPEGEAAAARQRKRLAHLEKLSSGLKKALYRRGELVKRIRDVESLVGGKICFIGSSATALTDVLVMPYREGFPGVGLHVNVLDTILNHRFIRRIDFGQELLLIAFLVLLSGVLFTQSSLQAGGMLGLALLGADWVVSASVLASHGFWVPVVGPWIAISTNCGALLALRYFTEVRQRNEIEKMFGYYLSPEVIEQLRADPSKLRRGGEEVEITALFTDLAGFSIVCERMTPAQVVELINDYLGECTDVLIAYHGTLERYEGDAIRAMFGAPIHRPDHAARACMAAIEMQAVVKRLRESHRETNRPEFRMRLGLNTGRAIVGNIGARNRFNFTMQGDSVNLASRLEGANKLYGTGMILGETTYRHAGDSIVAREIDRVRVAGRVTTLSIYELLGLKGAVESQVLTMAEIFAEGLAAYRARRWKDAIAFLERAMAAAGGVEPVSQLYLQRCRKFSETPPPEDWDGVFDVPKS